MTVTVEQLTKLLIESDRSNADRVQQAISRLGPAAGPVVAERVVAELLDARSITPLQAELLLAGRSLLMGHYVLCEKIGEGGMGTVYAARHRHMGRMVALKVIRPDRIRADGIERFQREIQLAARLRHTNIVAAYDAGEAEGSLYLVMELVDGCDLARRVRRQGVLRVAAALDALRQTALGLAYLHSQKIIHRDIKPSNLLLDRQGIVKILDLGLSRVVEWSEASQTGVYCDLTASGELMGSVDFMSPEQFVKPRSVDARADLYSLGCTLYGLLSGKPPYKGASSGERIVAHREHAIPSLRQVAPEAPPRLERLFQKLLAKDPNQRPNDANAVIAEIDALGILHPAHTTPMVDHSIELAETEVFGGPGVNASRRAWRRAKVVAGIGTVALVAGVLFTVGPLRGPKEQAVSHARGRPTSSANVEKAKPPAVPSVEKATASAATPAVVRNDGGHSSDAPPPRETAATSTDEKPDEDRTAALWAIKLGGHVQLEAATGFLSARSPGELPAEAFRVQRLNLSGLSLADADFPPFLGLKELDMVDLGQSDADNRALRVVGQAPSLTRLSLMGTQVDDRGLSLLSDLAGLTSLDLRATRVTDEGVAQLAACHALEELRLGEGQVLHDPGAEGLAKMRSLRSLGLRYTSITDKAVRALAALDRLEWLDLGGCRSLTDEGMAALSQFESLRHVLLDGVEISPPRLAELTSKQMRVEH